MEVEGIQGHCRGIVVWSKANREELSWGMRFVPAPLIYLILWPFRWWAVATKLSVGSLSSQQEDCALTDP